jgi:hypothetical protein
MGLAQASATYIPPPVQQNAPILAPSNAERTMDSREQGLPPAQGPRSWLAGALQSAQQAAAVQTSLLQPLTIPASTAPHQSPAEQPGAAGNVGQLTRDSPRGCSRQQGLPPRPGVPARSVLQQAKACTCC